MCRVTENLGLARSIAHKYSKYDKSMYEDLYQEACLWLVEADKTYDETKASFSTHATTLMNFKILVYLEKNNTPGITSRSAGKVAMRIRKLGLEKMPVDQISKELGISKERVVSVLDSMKNKASLNKDYEDSEESLVSRIPDKNAYNIIIHEKGLEKLNDLQRTSFKLSTMGYNNQEIAAITGLSERFVGKAVNMSREVLKEWTENFGEEGKFKMEKRTFNFIENGEVIDTFVVERRFDWEMFLNLKEYAEGKGVKVIESI